MPDYKYVLYEKDKRVVVITFNRPDRRNAFGLELRQDFNAALQAAYDDNEIRTIVVTGAGSAWSAGADLSREPGGPVEQFQKLETSVRYSQRSFLNHLWMRSFPKPIIAAVNGAAVGMSFELLLNMDIIIASEKAIFGAPEVRHGSIEMTRLPFIVGAQMAKRLLLTGDRIDAREAHRIGLVTEVVPAEKLMETALRLAKRIANVPRHAIMMNKLMVDGVMDDMGFMNAVSRAALYTGMGHYLMTLPDTDAAELFKILAEKGPKAFIDARDSNFPPEEGLPGTV